MKFNLLFMKPSAILLWVKWYLTIKFSPSAHMKTAAKQ